MWKELFMFAILSNMKEMAVLFLQYGDETTAKVLLACKMYSRMKSLYDKKTLFKTDTIFTGLTQNEM